MSEPIRLIRGTRTDPGDPGGEAIAIVYAPEPVPWPRQLRASRIRCRFLFDRDLHAVGVDDAQRIDLAVRLACDLLRGRGVRNIRVSVIPPEDRGRAILKYGFHSRGGALRKRFRYP
jgi:hypothetical protein